MVNFNFGLGGNNSQDDTTVQDDTGTQQKTVSTDDTAVPQSDIPAPPTNKAKPLTELMTEKEDTTANEQIPEVPKNEKITFDEGVIPEEIPPKIEEEKTETFANEEIPTKTKEEVSLENAPNAESIPETPGEKVKNTKQETPVNPFAVSAATETEPKTETKKEPPLVAPGNPFTKTTPSISEEKVEEKKTESNSNPFATPAVTETESKTEETKTTETSPAAPINPFATPVTPEIKEENPTETSQPTAVPILPTNVVSDKESKTEEKVVKQSMKPFPFSDKPKEDTKKEVTPEFTKETVAKATPFDTGDSVTATNDPMKAVGQVKNDIVAFVEFHKKNIRKFQGDISELEKKIQEEKKLLQDKGNSYTKMLKELQDLTQNFGIPRPQQGGTKPQPQHRTTPQHKPRPDHQK